jgi:hypothetical protein
MKALFGCLMVCGLAGACSKSKGCTHEFAINYDSTAEKDDGSCIYYDIYIYSAVASPTASESVNLKSYASADTDLSGWTIGDLNDPEAYSISSGTILSAGGALTLSASVMGFEIDDSGETIYLKDSSGHPVDTWTN